MVLIDFRWRALFHEMGLTGERFDRMAAATVLDPVWNEFDRGVWTDEMMLDAFIKRAPELEPELRDLMYNRFTELLKKYDYNVPEVLDQSLNRTIKEICKRLSDTVPSLGKKELCLH